MELSEELGHGSYGQVYRVEWRGTAYALKAAPLRLTDAEYKALPPVLHISDEHSDDFPEELLNGFLNEVRILHKLRDNPHIVWIEDAAVLRMENSISCCLLILMEKLESFTDYISSEKIDVVLEQALILNDVKVVGRRDNSAVTDSSRYKEQTYSNDPNVFHVVEQAPVFPGGQEGIMTYLSRNLRYPSVAREMQVEADIVVEFMVDKTGVVRGPHVISYTSTPLISAETAKAAKDGDPEAVEAAMYYYDAIEALKEEANYVVRQMPRWEPGRQNGQRVNTTFTLPISFKLQQ